MSADRKKMRTNFHAATIAICLSNARGKKAASIGSKAASFLSGQQSVHGTWNYWHSSSKEFFSEPYPDDMDDTASAVSAISLYHSLTLSGIDYAHFVKALCAQEIELGGPYGTWCRESAALEKWDDVDIGVNASIAYALSLSGVELLGLNSYIEESIENDAIESRYYHNPTAIIYLISRWYDGSRKHILIDKLHERLRDVSANDQMALSMILSSLYRLGESIERIAPHAFDLARSISCGPKAAAFYIEKIDSGKNWYSGSSALTAAFAAEALSLVMDSLSASDEYQDSVYEEIISRCHAQLNPKSILHEEKVTEAIAYGLGGENLKDIALMPFRCISLPARDSSKEEKLIELCTAHLLGTIAYGIFDNVADGDEKTIDPSFVSLGLIAHGKCAEIFDRSAPKREVVDDFFMRMGHAALWEQLYASFTCDEIASILCSIPDYDSAKILENKSIGIALAPLIAFTSLSPDQDSAFYLEEFFMHYCAARHMHDDAHDWQEDFEHGRLNSVSSMCMKMATHDTAASNQDELKNRIKEYFETEGIVAVANKILSHCDKAEDANQKLADNAYINTDFLDGIICRLRAGAKKALNETEVLEEFCLEFRPE